MIGTHDQLFKQDLYWNVLTTEKGFSGDLLIASGMDMQLVVMSVGAGYLDRGVRNDQHDTVAASLKFPIRIFDIGAPQPDVQSVA